MTASTCRTVLVVTGETSGEQHMARVMEEVARAGPTEVRWIGSGGASMRAQGLESLADVEELSAIGPRAALANLGAYWSLFRQIIARVRLLRPDLAVLVDFPDFNLRLAPRLKRLGVPVCYFISPQVWAWRPGRVETIRRYVDRMLVIFPFEVEFYRSRGVDAHFVGNPWSELLTQASGVQMGRASRLEKVPSSNGRPSVGLLPGSRRKEVEQILPIQLQSAALLQQSLQCRFLAVQAPGLPRGFLESSIEAWRQRSGSSLTVEILSGPATEIWPQLDCALVKSGTATLEALIFEVPFAMVYRMAPLSYRLLKPWVATETYCLANLVAGEEVVPEFVQAEARPEAISEFLLKLLSSPKRLSLMKQKLRNASERLGRRRAYPEAARHLLEMLKVKSKI